MNYAKLISKMAEKNDFSYFTYAFGMEYLNETIHTLSYEDILEICKILKNTDEGLCHYCGYDTKKVYIFQCCGYEECKLKEISNNVFKMLYCDESDNSIETQDYWIPVFLIKEFWDFYFNYINNSTTTGTVKVDDRKMACSLKLGEELKQSEINIDSICQTIAKDFIKNYNNYTNILNTLNCFSNVSENNCVEFFTNFLKRLF